jgi:hypothetical protein
MDITPNTLFSIFFVLLIGGLFYALLRRHNFGDSDGLTIFEHGQLLLQAHETAKIVVQGIQEAWRTGQIADDEREQDAVEKMVELYPQLDEDELRRIVKSSVYLLRKAAGKQVDKIMEHVPEMEPIVQPSRSDIAWRELLAAPDEQPTGE